MRRHAPALALGGILLLALLLRLWHIRHGLPFAYNADENEHFVPHAVAMARGGSLDPGYYENPPALTYLLFVVLKLAGTGDALLTSRIVVVLIGTLVVFLAYVAGAQAFEKRAGLVAAALMAVAFLPVFYSKQALNDVVTMAPVTAALIGSLLAWERGDRRWWVLAGAAVGIAAATKYTAGAMALTVAVAAALRVYADRAQLKPAAIGLALAAGAGAVAFLVLNPWAIIHFHEVRGQVAGQSAQADTGKLGQDDTYGWFYYLGTFGWGLGWLPFAAALAGGVLVLARDWRRGVLLVAFPVFLYLFLGSQGRFFGRWLLPIYPMLTVLAGYAVVEAARALGKARPRRVLALTAIFGALVCAQGLASSVRVDTVLGKQDTRTLALEWLREHVPPGTRIMVEPFVPAQWARAYAKYPVKRPFQAFEKRLRVARIEQYRRQGYCTVVVGSTQKERGLKAGLTSSRRYYAALDAASEDVVTFSPYRAGADPVRFSYDKSFNYEPRAYVRPGPVVEIHTLRDCTPRRG